MRGAGSVDDGWTYDEFQTWWQRYSYPTHTRDGVQLTIDYMEEKE